MRAPPVSLALNGVQQHHLRELLYELHRWEVAKRSAVSQRHNPVDSHLLEAFDMHLRFVRDAVGE